MSAVATNRENFASREMALRGHFFLLRQGRNGCLLDSIMLEPIRENLKMAEPKIGPEVEKGTRRAPDCDAGNIAGKCTARPSTFSGRRDPGTGLHLIGEPSKPSPPDC